MGKPTGFLEFKRSNTPCRPVKDRIKDYKEVYESISLEALRDQAARCMDCGVPFCHSLGCPLGNLIPEWNDAVYHGRFFEAARRLEETNNFPEITGRVCPALCEASCTLAINDGPVTIKQIELAIIEKAFTEGWIVPQSPKRETGKRVAVIGSGPAGVAAGQNLRRMGHRVTIFEKSDRIGGLLRYGIPDFKLEKWILDRRIQQLLDEGVEFETGVEVGEDISAGYLRKKFDAMVITVGSGVPRDLNVQGRGFEGIHFAMEFLSLSNKVIAGEIQKDRLISAKNKNVLVIGGGDTGSDCVGTAVRQGARSVYQFEILPKPQEWKEQYNPAWPDWPVILRTSSSHEEGVERRWGIETTRFAGRGIHVEKAYFQEVEWKESGRKKKPRPVPRSGSDFSLDVDLVLLAMGFLHPEHGKFVHDLGLELDSKGNIASKKGYMTSVPGVFVAGDALTGASLVVRAMIHGRNAAADVDSFL